MSCCNPIIVVALDGFCFGRGCLTAFIVTRTKFRNEMIRRGVARHNRQTSKWGDPPKKPKAWGSTIIQGAADCYQYYQNVGLDQCRKANGIVGSLVDLFRPPPSFLAKLRAGIF
jgi:hypothetical protein